jgi:transcriptional regulator with XRE-family HTH domain
MANEKNLPLRLREARIARGWSQTRLGALTNLTQGDVSAIETGRRRAGAERRLRLSVALGCPESVLFAPVESQCAPATQPPKASESQ